MNVCAFCGSLSDSSICEFAIHRYVDHLNAHSDVEINLFYINGNSLTINYNQGSNQEFYHGHSTDDTDDIKKLEYQLIKSDIIIFASPIYMHSVSGFMKNFIDSIGYWTHLLKLRGKVGISISSCHSNGVNFTSEYLDKILAQLGCSIESSVKLSTSIQNKTVIDSLIQYEAKKVMRKIRSKQFNITDFHEKNLKPIKICIIHKILQKADIGKKIICLISIIIMIYL